MSYVTRILPEQDSSTVHYLQFHSSAAKVHLFSLPNISNGLQYSKRQNMSHKPRLYCDKYFNQHSRSGRPKQYSSLVAYPTGPTV